MTKTCLLLLFVLVSRSDPSSAQTFTAFGPTSCPTQTTQNWVWDTNGDGAVERHFSDPSKYHNNQTTIRRFIANYRVSDMEFRFVDKKLVSGDQLMLHQFGRPVGDKRFVTGTSGSTTWEAVPSGTMQYPIEMTLTTNSTGIDEGFRIDQVRYCGLPTGPASPLDILSGERYTGILLGTNDVIFKTIMGPPSGRRLHIATWGGSFNANQDIYVRCGASPTTSNFLRRTNTSSPDDFLHVTYAECPAPQKVYIAINSNSGSGMFNLVAQQRGITTPGIFAVEGGSAGDHAVVVNSIQTAKQLLFGMTEGQVLLTPLELHRKAAGAIPNSHWACNSQCGGGVTVCNGCFLADIITSNAIRGSTFLMSGGDWHLPEILVHEMGHSYINTHDEYVTVPGLGSRHFCGHTNAAMLGRPDFCNGSNHGLEPHADAVTHGFTDNGKIWDGTMRVRLGRRQISHGNSIA